MAFYWDIPSLEKKIPIPVIKNARDIPKVRKPEKTLIPGIKIPKLRKTPNPGEKSRD